MSLSIGLQLYSVRSEMEKDPIGTLEKIAAIGYKNVELAIHFSDAVGNGGYTVAGLNGSELKKVFDRLGLKALNAQIFPIDVVNWERLFEFSKDMEMSAVSCSMSMFKNKQDTIEFSNILNRAGERCKKNGLDFYYHNHFQEFQKFEDEFVMDTILNHTNSEYVKIEFDTYWALRGGVDPCDYLRKLGNRCDLIHQKDLPTTAKPVNWFDFFGHDNEITLDMKLNMSKENQFIEIGDGIMDIPAILSLIREMGIVKTIFVEQDWTDRNEIESVALSYNRLSNLLNN